MSKRALQSRFILLILIFPVVALSLAAQNDPPRQQPAAPTPDPVFIRLTFYPTASLSRYDYNNDLDLFELRAYAEIRRKSQDGEVIPDALVTVLSEELSFQTDSYEKRIKVHKEDLPEKLEVQITLAGRQPIKRTFLVPDWLILQSPVPSVIDTGADLEISWEFSSFPFPVNIRIYDFRKGNTIFDPDHIRRTEVSVPGEKLPPSTILRIYAISTWLFKRYLTGQEFARGSEIVFIPWSQVFVRTK